MSDVINFITTNPYKFAVAQEHLSGNSRNLAIVQYDIETPELQSAKTEDVARSSASWVSGRLGEAAIASDMGFEIDALDGFPGPFVKYINQWLGPDDILKMMTGQPNRKAMYIHALAYADPDGSCEVFTSETTGTIAESSATGAEVTGSTTDRIFVPDGFSSTLANIPELQRERIWDNTCWDRLVRYIEE